VLSAVTNADKLALDKGKITFRLEQSSDDKVGKALGACRSVESEHMLFYFELEVT
jgi:hypothetical protein